MTESPPPAAGVRLALISRVAHRRAAPTGLRARDRRWAHPSWLDRLPPCVPPDWHPRLDVPATRGDCPTAGACPHVRCRHHLWLREGTERAGRRTAQGRNDGGRFEATEAPSVRLLPLQSLLRPATAIACSLDVADHQPGGLSYQAIGTLLGITEERARQIAVGALRAAAREVARLQAIEATEC